MKVIGYVWTLLWNGRKSDPPDGVWVKAERFVPSGSKEGAGKCPDAVESLWSPGCGYSICIEAITKPGTRRTPAQMASIRKNALRKRLEKHYPLFAEQMYAEELAKRPDYYAGKHPRDAEREKLLQSEQERYERYMKIIEEMRVQP